MRNSELPIIQGATLCEFTTKEDGTPIVIINGNEYPESKVINTYAVAYTKYKNNVDIDLLIEEHNKNNFSKDFIDDYEVYSVYYLVEGVTIDESNRVIPHGKIIGARLLNGYDKEQAYNNLSQTKEINKLLKAVIKQ